MQTNLSIFLFVTLTTMFLFSADLSAAKGLCKQTSSAESAAKSLYAARLEKKRAEALKVARLASSRNYLPMAPAAGNLWAAKSSAVLGIVLTATKAAA